jgi:1,4-alpha-glucan branching enzyme
LGGLGFGMKWMMGWMNDTLKYFEKDPMYRKWHQDQITFSLVYAFSENFMLPLSHDEVVYGKGSLIGKMPGDEWQRFANLRVLFTYMYTHPGTKLVFMGGEFGQSREWNFEQSLDWHLLQQPTHKGINECMKALNQLLRTQPALHDHNFAPEGFEWIDAQDRENCIVVYERKGLLPKDSLVVISNMTPMPRQNYRIGVPAEGKWQEVFNSDSPEYYGSGVKNTKPIATDPEKWHNRAQSITLTIPPLAAIVLKKV